MLWKIVKESNRAIDPSLEGLVEWPNTITTAVALRMRYDSFNEFSEPLPVEHWDYPHMVEAHIERLYPHTKNRTSGGINLDDVND